MTRTRVAQTAWQVRLSLDPSAGAMLTQGLSAQLDTTPAPPKSTPQHACPAMLPPRTLVESYLGRTRLRELLSSSMRTFSTPSTGFHAIVRCDMNIGSNIYGTATIMAWQHLAGEIHNYLRTGSFVHVDITCTVPTSLAQDVCAPVCAYGCAVRTPSSHVHGGVRVTQA